MSPSELARRPNLSRAELVNVGREIDGLGYTLARLNLRPAKKSEREP